MARAVAACMVAVLSLLPRCSSELGAAQDSGLGAVQERKCGGAQALTAGTGASASLMQGAACKHEMTLVTCTWGNGRCYRPTLCTHDPVRDFVSGVLHKEGSYGTIRDLEMVCASGLVTCDSGRTFVDCGAALGHLTVAAAAFGMTGDAYVSWSLWGGSACPLVQASSGLHTCVEACRVLACVSRDLILYLKTQKTVIAIEPLGANTQLLQKSLARNGMKTRVSIHQAGISAQGGDAARQRATFSSVPGNFAASIVDSVNLFHFDVTEAQAEATAQESVRLVPLPELVPQMDVELLALNCQGCEYEALLSLGAQLSRVKGVLLYVYFGLPRATTARAVTDMAVSLLRDSGFCLFDITAMAAAVLRDEAPQPISDFEAFQDRVNPGAWFFIFASRQCHAGLPDEPPVFKHGRAVPGDASAGSAPDWNLSQELLSNDVVTNMSFSRDDGNWYLREEDMAHRLYRRSNSKTWISAQAWLAGPGSNALHSQPCTLSQQIVCTNIDELYQEIFNTEATFVAYLHITGSTRQLHRFEPVPGNTGVYRAHFRDYGQGLVYKSKILVLLNSSVLHGGQDTCSREENPSLLYRQYRFKWFSTGQRLTVGPHFRVASVSADSELAALMKMNLPDTGKGPAHPTKVDRIETLVQFHLAYPQDQIAKRLHLTRLGHALTSICFFGDSHMRNNAYWLYPGCTGFKHSYCPVCRFFFISYARDFLQNQDKWGDAEFCPVVVLNFGHWDLAFWDQGYEDYVAAVQSVLEAYLAVRSRESLIWTTMNPRPLQRRCEKEWRFLDVIERFNEGARAVVAARNVAVWDTYELLKHVFDLTYDGDHGHYKFPTAVGLSLAVLLSQMNIWQTIILGLEFSA